MNLGRVVFRKPGLVPKLVATIEEWLMENHGEALTVSEVSSSLFARLHVRVLNSIPDLINWDTRKSALNPEIALITFQQGMHAWTISMSIQGHWVIARGFTVLARSQK